jgi:hypothetical protein
VASGFNLLRGGAVGSAAQRFFCGVVSAAVVVGCASEPLPGATVPRDSVPQSPPAKSIPGVSQPQRVSQEVDEVFSALRWVDAEAHQVLDERRARGSWQCMQDRGFKFAFEAPLIDNFDPAQRRWGVASLPDAEQFGFALPPQFMASSAGTAEVLLYDSLTAAQKVAFEQASTGGANAVQTATIRVGELGTERTIEFWASPDSCASEGLIAAYGSFELYAEYEAYRKGLGGTIGSFEDRAAASPEFTQALDVWSACLTNAGYTPGADPVAFTESFIADLSGPVAIQAAVTDVKCKNEASLMPVWQTTLARFARDEIPRLSEAIQRMNEIRNALVVTP